MSEKFKQVLKQVVQACEYRAGDVSTEDGDFATTDIDFIKMLQEALYDDLDAPSDTERSNLLCFKVQFKRYYGDNIETLEDLFDVFCKYCKVGGYGEIIYDDRFIGLFESTQEFLIEKGLISESQCMRT